MNSRVLILDDNQDNVAIFNASFKKFETLVLNAGSFEKCNELLAQFSFDLIIVNLERKIGGIDLLKFIIQMEMKAPIIILSNEKGMPKEIMGLKFKVPFTFFGADAIQGEKFLDKVDKFLKIGSKVNHIQEFGIGGEATTVEASRKIRKIMKI